MSPVHNFTRRKARPSWVSRASAHAVIRSCSASDWSGVVIVTISTLSNWCWRLKPRVSRPAAPAPERKHGVSAAQRDRQRVVQETKVPGPAYHGGLLIIKQKQKN